MASGRFNTDVTLPRGLELGHIRKAIDKVESELVDWIDLYFEQMNIVAHARHTLEGKAAYERTDVVLRAGKWVARNGEH